MLGCAATIVLLLGLFAPAAHFASPRTIREVNPPEVPPAVAAIEVRRNAWWVRQYHHVWCQYPRDICSAFPRLVAMVAVGLVDVGAAVTVGFVLLTLSIWVLINTWHALTRLPVALSQTAWWAVTVLPRAIAAGARYAASASVTYQLLIATAAVALLVLFLRSQAWQLTRLWIRAKRSGSASGFGLCSIASTATAPAARLRAAGSLMENGNVKNAKIPGRFSYRA